jgi:hypothetical protein
LYHLLNKEHQPQVIMIWAWTILNDSTLRDPNEDPKVALKLLLEDYKIPLKLPMDFAWCAECHNFMPMYYKNYCFTCFHLALNALERDR